MWAVVKYQIKKKTRNTRSGPALRVLDDNDEGCGLRKITIDFNHEDYRGTFKHIIRKPLQYEYYYCAGIFEKYILTFGSFGSNKNKVGNRSHFVNPVEK